MSSHEDASRPAAVAVRPGQLPCEVRGAMFDMCNVLCDETAWRRWILQLLTHMGLKTRPECLFRVWDRDYLDDVNRGLRTPKVRNLFWCKERNRPADLARHRESAETRFLICSRQSEIGQLRVVLSSPVQD